MKLLSLLLLFFSSAAFAEGVELQTNIDDEKRAVTVSFEMAQFALPAGTISGMGGKVEYTHYLTKKISIDPFFAMAFGTQGGVSSTFTGFGGYVNYSLLGDCCSSKKAIAIEGRALVTEEKPRTSLLRVGLGFDQVFLNGDKAVYPASGLGAGASYEFPLLGFNFRLAARTSFMTANSQSIQALFFGAGINFPF